MFYSEAILSKKGPLAKVWLAAHWERKLTKNQLLQTNLHSSVDAIVGTDQAPMALRLSGQLLLGVARIYSRKTKYLLEDCNEALMKIKVFRSDASSKDSNLLALDANAEHGAGSRAAAAAFNAITVPDAMTEYDLLMPAQAIDISAWGLHPKLNHLSDHRDITLESNEGDLLSATGNYQALDHGRRHMGLDIEVGRTQMNRIGGGGYRTMDFDLAGPDDALDLGMFDDDLATAGEFDFLKRNHRRDDLEIEIGRDAATTRRSASAEPFGMVGLGEKQGALRLGEGSEDGRAPSVHGSVQDQPAFDEFLPIQDGARGPLNFEIAEEGQQGPNAQQQPMIKKRKLVVDAETEMTQEDFMANGLLTTHEMLPRSRKLLRLQQIEQDVAHGGLAGYLLDCTAGPRVMGGALVPELASMFSRRLQIVQEEPLVEAQKGGALWQQDKVETWMEQVHDDELDFGMRQITPPPADTFDDFRLGSPTREGQAEATAVPGVPAEGSLFQEMEELNAPVTTTKQLLGTVFSTSTIQTMRLVQQGLEYYGGVNADEDQGAPSRSTRTATVATASSAQNKGNTARVKFTELMEGPAKSQQKRNKAAASKLFFELLVLATKDVVKVEQEESFGEIAVGGSPWLETLVKADAETAEQQALTEAEVQA
ncbi:Rec8 like protein-domain-containing protein [Gamsiella multidivaricata]|uniref:Rec8 like protein-domain-containing protein n=1 Tax=Gamsiella multidivaricata TaxID=101098 RepID=UPI00221F0C09|nr:Rec8 like protein-domain-containing protein [Gamsiella multidivaricata]KAI7816097.1 Rec8 like protein-domain-containing protein [Gamsiella multidivaricata]